jgi:hypothetical protein
LPPSSDSRRGAIFSPAPGKDPKQSWSGWSRNSLPIRPRYSSSCDWSRHNCLASVTASRPLARATAALGLANLVASAKPARRLAAVSGR